MFIADQQSFIPSLLNINPPSPFNGTDGTPSSFGSTCGVLNSDLYQCTNNTDNPLFDCSASNNSYYGWDRGPRILVAVEFSNNFQSMNILVTFLISTSNDVSTLLALQYVLFHNQTAVSSTNTDYPPTDLPEGPYQHNLTASSDMMFDGILITITPNTTFQWVAINRIIFCAAATEGLWSSPPLIHLTTLLYVYQ